MEDQTKEWLTKFPSRVYHAYTNAKHIAQVPVFARLLRLIQYPQADILETELTEGFQLMGDIQPGTSWYIRTDQKYVQPKSPQEFIDDNYACNFNSG